MTDTLLPINATVQECALEASTARISDVPVLVREAWNPDTCPSALLPWLAQAFTVDAWDPSWSDAQKRQTIKDSVFVHRHKGTIGAVERALASLGLTAQVQEWFNQLPAGAPYTFSLLLESEQVGFDQSQLARLQDVVEATKNLRSHLTEIAPQVVTAAGVTSGGVAGMGTEITSTGFEYSLVADGTKTANALYRASGIDVSYALLADGEATADGSQAAIGARLN